MARSGLKSAYTAAISNAKWLVVPIVAAMAVSALLLGIRHRCAAP